MEFVHKIDYFNDFLAYPQRCDLFVIYAKWQTAQEGALL